MKFLYSVNSYLSYKICEHFYGNIYYIWASPNYNSKGINPPSSDPFEICSTYVKDIEGTDDHSSQIAANKTGLLKGANAKLSEGIINDNQYGQIISIIEKATFSHFRPLIYIMSYSEVKDLTAAASIELKAGFFSQEYLLTKLPRDKFDVITIFKNERYVQLNSN